MLTLTRRNRINAFISRVLDWICSPVTRHASDETYFSCRTRGQLLVATLKQRRG
jgi:hypothetical protein